MPAGTLWATGSRLVIERFPLGRGENLADGVTLAEAAFRQLTGCRATRQPIRLAGREGVFLTCTDGDLNLNALYAALVADGDRLYLLTYVFERSMEFAEELPTFQQLLATFEIKR